MLKSFLRLATKSSSAAPKPSSAVPKSSSRRPKPSSRAQLEPYFKKPIFTTLSRQTPCDFSAEKSTSHLSATPLMAPHDPGIPKLLTTHNPSSRAHLPLNMSATQIHNPFPGCTFRRSGRNKSQNMSAHAAYHAGLLGDISEGTRSDCVYLYHNCTQYQFTRTARIAGHPSQPIHSRIWP